MKTFLKIGLLVFFFIGSTSCEKDDTPEIEKLPPATQTGEGIFACLINGRAFIHDDGVINCYYQYVDGGYYFRISGQEDSDDLFSIRIATDNKEIKEGLIYQLIEKIEGNAWGGGLLHIKPLIV